MLIAAAIVCAAVCSHGANYLWNQWDCDSNFSEDSVMGTWDGATVYTVLATVWNEQIAAGGIESAKWIADNSLTEGVSFEDRGDGAAFTDDISFSRGTTIEDLAVYEVLVQDVDATHGYMAVARTLTGQDPVNPAVADSFTNEELVNQWTAQGGAWAEYAVSPEPTSGLLLLIGVAGLALRRRRA